MVDEKLYTAAVNALFERHCSVQSAGFTEDSYKPGLENMLRFDSALGNPSSAFTSIHVAGTNGKGSVCTMTAASLASAGASVGLYTSPHLLDFRERMKIITPDGCEMIPREYVMEFLETFGKETENLSFFEITTGMAFRWFADRKVDCAVIETGLGGRLDSTNIIIPRVSVISSIGLDHCAILGHTRGQIAREKAGIFKRGVPSVVWGHDKETDPVFEMVAREKDSRLVFADGSSNEATALAALEASGLAYGFRNLEESSRLTLFRGRWELYKGIILDIGHNPQALQRNFSRLLGLDTAPIIVYGVMADKDYRSIAALVPSGATLILTQPETPRALPLGELSEVFRTLRPDLDIYEGGSVAASLDLAFKLADAHAIYAGGSTFVVSDAIKYLDSL